MLNKQLSRKLAILAVSALSVSSFASAAKAVNFVNGNFESTTGTVPGELGYNGVSATGWDPVVGLNLVYTPGSADTTGAATQYPGTIQLYGPGNGHNNGLTATSPVGGNYIALDGTSAAGIGPGPASISQTVSDLIVGQEYAVSFWWAAGQQFGFPGDTTDQLIVSFGGETQSTPVVNVPNAGFHPWEQKTFTFKATNTTQVLKFLANGTPDGVPPFALLDGVTVNSVPEAPVYIGGVVALGLGSVLRSKMNRKK
jgi:hypothetical protein